MKLRLKARVSGICRTRVGSLAHGVGDHTWAAVSSDVFLFALLALYYAISPGGELLKRALIFHHHAPCVAYHFRGDFYFYAHSQTKPKPFQSICKAITELIWSLDTPLQGLLRWLQHATYRFLAPSRLENHITGAKQRGVLNDVIESQR